MADVRILNSWKEISGFIGRGVRTVQRWEELYGLPVHRAAGRNRSAVYALSDELDAWLRSGKTHVKPQEKTDFASATIDNRALMEQADVLTSRVDALERENVWLRAQLESERKANKAARRSPATPARSVVADLTRRKVG